MKLTVDLSRLEAARDSIGARKADIGLLSAPESVSRSPIEIRLIKEGSIVLSGEELSEVLHFPAGLVAIGNTQITLHIYQPFVSEEDLRLKPAPNPKFHVCDCSKLDEMRRGGRFNRYVSKSDRNMLFKVQPYDHMTKIRGEEIEAHLKPCIICLKQLNYDGFSEKAKKIRTDIVENFDFEKFLENYDPVFRCLPLYTPENFPEGNYTSDWACVSEDLRRAANWKCSQCKVNLSSNRGLLHVHHIDGNRGNNRPSNLKVLCCACHQAQPHHQRMHISQKARDTILRLREE